MSAAAGYDRAAAAFAISLGAHHDATGGHVRRVRRLALTLGRAMGLLPVDLANLADGALLHDVGKLCVPGELLDKLGRPTAEEWERLRSHTWRGAEMVRDLYPTDVVRVVAEHHERWDGSGYPLGLRGGAIDLNARIFAVADAFDAMTSDRVYRAGRPYDHARAELERCAGRHFDPRVVEAFKLVPAAEWESLRRRKHAAAAGDGGSSRTRAASTSKAAAAAPHARRARPGNFGNRARIRHF